VIFLSKKIASTPPHFVSITFQNPLDLVEQRSVLSNHPIFESNFFKGQCSNAIEIKEISPELFDHVLATYEAFPLPSQELPLEVSYLKRKYEISLKLGDNQFLTFDQTNFAPFYKAIQLISGSQSTERLKYFNLIADLRQLHKPLSL
jgi:hypothetical protein